MGSRHDSKKDCNQEGRKEAQKWNRTGNEARGLKLLIDDVHQRAGLYRCLICFGRKCPLEAQKATIFNFSGHFCPLHPEKGRKGDYFCCSGHGCLLQIKNTLKFTSTGHLCPLEFEYWISDRA